MQLALLSLMGIRWSAPLSQSSTQRCGVFLGLCQPRSYQSCHHFM